jgi:rubredoxin
VTDHKCPECGRTMKEGFVLDRGHNNAAKASTWVEGQPERSMWFGLKLRSKRKYAVTTWRCDSCGLLKSFARIETR